LYLFQQNQQDELDNALLATGAIKAPLIKSEWRGTLSSGPYAMAGTFKAYGCACGAYIQNNEYFGIGARWSFMQMRSACELRRLEKGFPNYFPIILSYQYTKRA